MPGNWKMQQMDVDFLIIQQPIVLFLQNYIGKNKGK